MNGESYINLISNEKEYKARPVFDTTNIQKLIDSVLNDDENFYSEQLTKF